jgi:TonB-linked SusC/RagA family outer membrane protein
MGICVTKTGIFLNKEIMKRLCLLFVLLLMAGVNAIAQNTHTVTGKVLDEKGLGYPGAGIMLKGTKIGTVTDINGDFMLDVPDGDKNVLIVSAVGYDTKEMKETEQTMTIKLHQKARELEGAVVTSMAIKREKRELGYNTTTVNAEDLTAGNNTSTLSALQGKVAGANITSSTGGPGGSTRIVLRGEKSFLGDNNALVIVDGVITNNYDRTSDATGLAQIDFGNSANDIDPDEIESITVLNGPAAAALYGAQGSKGAIMITTKKGKHGVGKKSKMEVTYKATYTQSDVLKYPEVQSKYGQGAIDAGITDDRGDNFSWGLPFDGQLKPWGQVIDGKSQVKPYSFEPNNMRQFFNQGKDLNNFVSVSGGDDKTTYYLSLEAMNSSGVVPNTFYNRYSVRFNSSTQLNNNFYSSINVNYINNYSRVEAEGQHTGGIMQALLQIPTDVPIASLSDLNNPFNSMSYLDPKGVQRYGYYGAFTSNPYWVAQYYDNRNKTDRILGNVNLGYKKGDFDVFDRVGLDVADDRSYYETPELNSASFDQSIYYPSYPHTNAGGYSVSNATYFSFYNDLIGTYTHQLSQNFGMTALIGNNTTIKQSEGLNGSISSTTNGLVIPYFYNLSNNLGPVTTTNSFDKHRTYAWYGDVKFNYQRELYLELTGRNEWSSTLASNENEYFYPGANAAWVFTERLHGNFKDKVLNYGKVRIGTSGVSQDASAYANNTAGYAQSSINTGFGTIRPPFNQVPAFQVQNTFGDPNLKPELTREYETGVDLSFFHDRLAASFTYYNDLTHGEITPIPLPPSAGGYSAEFINLGDVSNKGEEVSLRGTPISTKWGLKWDLFATYTHNVNNVESLAGNASQITIGGFQGMGIVAAVGHPMGTFYANAITYENGHAVVDPNTGLPVPTSKPVLLGSFQPKFQASWGTNVTYKGFTLHVLFVTKQGGEYYSNTKELMDFVGTATETTNNNRLPTLWANSVNQVGTTNNYVTNTTKYLPYNYWVNEVGSNQLQAQNLVNASYVKLQEASLGYKIPQKYYQNTCFGGLELGIFGNNLILWTAKSNKYDDPEEMSSGAISNAQGFNFNARPSLRNYGAYLKVMF